LWIKIKEIVMTLRIGDVAPDSTCCRWLWPGRSPGAPVRRVVIEHEGRTIAEFPLTLGVVGAVLAPVVAAIAAVVALFKDCTIHVERADVKSEPGGEGPAKGKSDSSAV